MRCAGCGRCYSTSFRAFRGRNGREHGLQGGDEGIDQIRKGFEEGELMCLRTMFGYRISKETGIEVDSKNAGIVREIYARKTRFPAASAPRLEPANSQPFFPLSQQPPFMAYLLLMHFCPFSPILLFKLLYLGATEQLRCFYCLYLSRYKVLL